MINAMSNHLAGTAFSHHWNNDGEWSIYSYEDVFRGLHKKASTGEVSYFEFARITGDTNFLIDAAEKCTKTYSKLRNWNSCIRCGTHKNLDTRTDFNNAMFCNRCYEATKTFTGSGIEYEILDCGLKGKAIKEEK